MSADWLRVVISERFIVIGYGAVSARVSKVCKINSLLFNKYCGLTKMVLKSIRRGFGVTYPTVVRSKKKDLFPNRFGIRGAYRFTKFHKLVNHGSYAHTIPNIVLADSPYSSGVLVRVVPRSPNFRYLADFNMKSCQNLIKKPYKRFIRSYVYPYLGVTKKPAEVRMGKGKGSKISHRVFPVHAGFRLFSGVRRSNARTSDFRLRDKVHVYVAKYPVSCSSQIGSF
jgi:hypothetical protein